MSVNSEADKKRNHEIRLIGRAEMSIAGVEEVESFDDQSVRLQTLAGELYVEGSGIKIGTLDTESGRVSITGRINALYYGGDEASEKKGFFSRLIR